jgi:hypothetical protein
VRECVCISRWQCSQYHQCRYGWRRCSRSCMLHPLLRLGMVACVACCHVEEEETCMSCAPRYGCMFCLLSRMLHPLLRYIFILCVCVYVCLCVCMCVCVCIMSTGIRWCHSRCRRFRRCRARVVIHRLSPTSSPPAQHPRFYSNVCVCVCACVRVSHCRTHVYVLSVRACVRACMRALGRACLQAHASWYQDGNELVSK